MDGVFEQWAHLGLVPLVPVPTTAGRGSPESIKAFTTTPAIVTSWKIMSDVSTCAGATYVPSGSSLSLAFQPFSPLHDLNIRGASLV